MLNANDNGDAAVHKSSTNRRLEDTSCNRCSGSQSTFLLMLS